MGINERVGHAFHSGNLRQKEGDCDLDVLTAAGMAAASATVGVDLLHIRHEGVALAQLDRVLQTASEVAARRGLRFGLNRERGFWRLFAQKALDFYIDPHCPRCHGVGQLRMEDAPTLGIICDCCRGSGERKLPKVGNTRMDRVPYRDRFLDLIEWFDSKEAKAITNIARKLRQES